MKMSRSEVESVLTPYHSRLTRCIHLGCSDYFTVQPNFPHPVKTRSAATLTCDFIESHIRREFDGCKDVTLLTTNQLFIMVVRDQLAIRFKKFHSDKMPRNIPTLQTVEYMNQTLDLPNFPVHARIIIGYELNSLQTQVKEITVTYPNGKRNFWSYEISVDGSSRAGEIVELPMFEADSEIPMRAREDEKKQRERKRRQANE